MRPAERAALMEEGKYYKKTKVSAENCDRSTVERTCGGEISNAVCITTQY